MHKTLNSRLVPVLLLAALVVLLSVTGGCVKKSEVTWANGEYANPNDEVTVERVLALCPPVPAPVEEPKPAPAPVPVPLPEPTAKYTPKPKPVVVPEIPGLRTDRRSYLIPNPDETAYEDFGLCAYTLLPHMYPSQNSGIYNRYVKMHQAFKSIPQFEKQERRGPDEVNVLYWNLKRQAFSENAYKIFDMSHGFYVQNYDYQRAKGFLDQCNLNQSGGPYIIAARGQLTGMSGNDPDQQELLVIDLSRVHEDAFKGVVASFFHRVLKNQFTWKDHFELNRIQAAVSGPASGQKPDVYLLKWVNGSYAVAK